MIDLLTDDEGQPIIMLSSPSAYVWDSFDLNKASEFDLIFLLKSSALARFQEIDVSLTKFNSITVFNTDCLEYLAEIFEESKRFDTDLSRNLVLKFKEAIGIVSISNVNQKLELICATQSKAHEIEQEELITKVVNVLLHWLWIYMNSF